jgi:hypothetical protein
VAGNRAHPAARRGANATLASGFDRLDGRAIAVLGGGTAVADEQAMADRPTWKLTDVPAPRPRGKVRRLLTAAGIAIGSVCGIGPLAACNYKGCRYDDGSCYERPDSGVPDLAGVDMAGSVHNDDLGGHD